MLPEYSFFAPARLGCWNLAGNHSQPTNSLYHHMMVWQVFYAVRAWKATHQTPNRTAIPESPETNQLN
ncbi:hypothetical protein F6360_20630 [Escherichia coli]|nr:hypothetical protein [Escherichia coli]